MSKKTVCIVLVFLLTNLCSLKRVEAAPTSDKEAQFVERVKESILKIGTGPNARVEVKLRDNRKFNGYVSEAGDESFAIVDAKSLTSTTIPYPQVKHVKGHNLSTGAKIAIGVGIAVGVLVILIVAFKDHIIAY